MMIKIKNVLDFLQANKIMIYDLKWNKEVIKKLIVTSNILLKKLVEIL